MISAVEILKALADETRLRIVNLIYEKELCVCDIMEALNITQTKASRHLGVLRNTGIIADRKSAQWVYYSIPEDVKTNFFSCLINETLGLEQIYIDDKKSLQIWLERKNTTCI